MSAEDEKRVEPGRRSEELHALDAGGRVVRVGGGHGERPGLGGEDAPSIGEVTEPIGKSVVVGDQDVVRVGLSATPIVCATK